jgi:hypothetical protein
LRSLPSPRYDNHHGFGCWYLHLLRDPAAAYCVENLEVENTEHRPRNNPAWNVQPEDETLIREAVDSETWIPEKGQFIEELLAGEEDAMVTLMILRMPNLKRLSLPTECWGGLDFKYLIPIAARIAQVASEKLQPTTAMLSTGTVVWTSRVSHLSSLCRVFVH